MSEREEVVCPIERWDKQGTRGDKLDVGRFAVLPGPNVGEPVQPAVSKGTRCDELGQSRGRTKFPVFTGDRDLT